MRVFSLDPVALSERTDTLAGAFASYPIPLALELAGADRLRADFDRSTVSFGTVEAFRVAGASGVVRREAVRDSALPELVTVHLERGSHVVLEQDGRSAAPRPGDLVLSSGRMPFATRQEWVSSQRTISLDASALGLPAAAVDRATAIALDSRDPVFGPVSRFLSDIAGIALRDTDPLVALAPVVIEMMRVLVATISADESHLRSAMALTLGERVVAFVDMNLCDPELSAGVIARAHSISLRYLYVLMRQQGVSLGEYIRSHRVSRACELVAAEPDRMPLAEVARRCGFSDYSSFARAFRAERGMAPRDYREAVASALVHDSPSSLHDAPTTSPEVSA